MIKQALICFIGAAFLASAFYVGISRDLCRRDNITPSEYASMKLDCSFWLYR